MGEDTGGGGRALDGMRMAVDSGGRRWTVVDGVGRRWTAVDSGGRQRKEAVWRGRAVVVVIIGCGQVKSLIDWG